MFLRLAKVDKFVYIDTKCDKVQQKQTNRQINHDV